ncbi:MAG: hypothetical protein AAF465_05650 [Pseudomonadota bacterium]
MQPHLPRGIRVEEGARQQAIKGVEIRPTAFLGACQRGPLNVPTPIDDYQTFTRLFGDPSEELTLPYALRLFFSNGGRQALVVRVALDALPAALALPAGEANLLLWSKNPGAHDYLRAAVDYDGIDALDGDCFNLTLQRLAVPDTEQVIDQEIFRYVSVAPDHPHYLPHVLAGSGLMRCDTQVSPQRPDATLNHSTGKAQYFQGLTHPGRDGNRLTMATVLGSSETRTGLFALTEQYEFGQLYIPPLDFDTDVAVPVLRAAARVCDRRHALLIADAPRAWRDAATALDAVERFSLRGPCVALYYPWLESIDGVETQRKTMPPGGAVAGLLERSIRAKGPAATPAGNQMLLRGFRKFAETLNERDSFELAEKGVNTLRYAKGGRKVVWDAVLLNGNDHGVHTSIKVRRVLQYLSCSIERGLQWVANEAHSDHLWRRVTLQVGEFLTECMHLGMLAGNTPDNAFEVHCDLNTNPAARRQRGELGIRLELAPLLPSRFISLNIVVPVARNESG